MKADIWEEMGATIAGGAHPFTLDELLFSTSYR
jgi:hypothetical protein